MMMTTSSTAPKKFSPAGRSHTYNGNGGLKYRPERTHQSKRDAQIVLWRTFTIATMLSEAVFLLFFMPKDEMNPQKNQHTQQQLSQRSHRFTFLGL